MYGSKEEVEKYSNRKGLGFSLTRMPYKPIA